jgi:2,3-bisphosphoglycerate-dependent phosphoglycerate mutase
MNADKKSGKLIISRHAESEWNALGKWTGLTDVNLSDEGHKQAEQLGHIIKDIPFAVAYHSEQKRTHQTLDGIVRGAEAREVTRHQHGAVNERDYGHLTGKNKWEVKEEIGEEAFHGIRRGWDHPVPGGETLKDVHERVVPFYINEIVPRLQNGENILLVAHGNSIRALMKFIEQIPEADMAEVEVPLGTILMYHVTPEGHMADKEVRTIELKDSKA